jgi:hypothetical protein
VHECGVFKSSNRKCDPPWLFWRLCPDHEQVGSYALESNETFQDWRFRERVRATLSALNCLDEAHLS